MRWIATAAMAWGVVLGTTGAPTVGEVLGTAGAVAFAALTGIAVRRERAARAERGSESSADPFEGSDRRTVGLLAARAGAPEAGTPTSGVEFDRLLLDLYWNFRRVDDVALLAGCTAPRAQARLVELLLEPSGPVTRPAAEPVIFAEERRELILAWAAGTALPVLAVRAGRSEYSVGRVLLEHAEQPVGLTV